MISTDPGCPSDEAQVATTPSSPSCPAEGVVCKYDETTLAGGACVSSGQSIYTGCGGRWIGADTCPKPVPGQNPACPAELPNDNSFNPAACSTSGLKCGYYPVGPQDNQQQDIACCSGNASLGQTGLHWRFCFPTGAQSAPTAPSCTCP